MRTVDRGRGSIQSYFATLAALLMPTQWAQFPSYKMIADLPALPLDASCVTLMLVRRVQRSSDW